MADSKNWRENKRHCAVLAFPLGGHARPLLGLVGRLARNAPSSDMIFSFINTAKSNLQIFSETKGSLPPNIVPYDIPDGTPRNYDFTRNRHEPADLFLQAAPENFNKAIKLAGAEAGIRVSSIIADAFLTFVGEFAEEMHIPWILVWISMPYSLYVYLEMDSIRRIGRDGNEGSEMVPGVHAMRIEDLPEGMLVPGEFEESSVLVETLNNIGKVTARATAVVMNFYQELDPTSLTSALGSKLTNLLYLGFLTLSLPSPLLPPRDSDVRTNSIAWLGCQKSNSVAYISFGTIATLPQDELCSLAEALETSNVPYIWSLSQDLTDKLPDGFQDRTRTHGKILTWAPQAEILTNPATGVFVTHCGSNSVYESVAHGVPMICRPFFGDHRMNGRIVAEVWKIGVTLEGGRITKENMLKSLHLVLAHEAGEKMKQTARDLKQLAKVAAGPEGKAAEDFKTLMKIIKQGE